MQHRRSLRKGGRRQDRSHIHGLGSALGRRFGVQDVLLRSIFEPIVFAWCVLLRTRFRDVGFPDAFSQVFGFHRFWLFWHFILAFYLIPFTAHQSHAPQMRCPQLSSKPVTASAGGGVLAYARLFSGSCYSALVLWSQSQGPVRGYSLRAPAAPAPTSPFSSLGSFGRRAVKTAKVADNARWWGEGSSGFLITSWAVLPGSADFDSIVPSSSSFLCA